MVPAKIKWYVWADGHKIPRTASMRGQWGYDVECACGWKTHTGGATKKYIANQIYLHKLMDHDSCLSLLDTQTVVASA